MSNLSVTEKALLVGFINPKRAAKQYCFLKEGPLEDMSAKDQKQLIKRQKDHIERFHSIFDRVKGNSIKTYFNDESNKRLARAWKT